MVDKLKYPFQRQRNIRGDHHLQTGHIAAIIEIVLITKIGPAVNIKRGF